MCITGTRSACINVATLALADAGDSNARETLSHLVVLGICVLILCSARQLTTLFISLIS